MCYSEGSGSTSHSFFDFPFLSVECSQADFPSWQQDDDQQRMNSRLPCSHPWEGEENLSLKHEIRYYLQPD